MNAQRYMTLCSLSVILSITHLAANQAQLADAVKNRDKQRALALLKGKGGRANVNAAQSDGARALHWAAHWDELDIADLLIRAGADVNAANDFGVTALSLAATNGSFPMVDRLLKAGANPNATLPSGATALMTATRAGKVAAVKALLDRGADVNAKETSLGQTALMWAAADGNSEVVQTLLEHKADVQARSKAGFTPLLLAAREAHLETIRILLAAGVSVNESAADGTTALLIATIRGQKALAEFLLEHGADPNAGAGFTPLHWVVGNWDRGQAGTKSVLRPEDSEWEALHGLHGEKKLEFVKLLLTHGANPNAEAKSMPRYEGKGGPDPFKLNLTVATPFFIAARSADVPVMRLLLEHGADPSATTSQKTTALMAAAGIGHSSGSVAPSESAALEAVKLCLELGNDINAVNADGETALHGATYRGLEGADSIVQFLIDKGAKINVKNKKGWSPLTIAEGISFLGGAGFSQSPSAAALLRKLGAEPSPPDVERSTSVLTAPPE